MFLLPDLSVWVFCYMSPIYSTNWTDTTRNSTNWSDSSRNSTDWTDGSINSTNWESDDPSFGALLLENGHSLLLENSNNLALE